MSHDSKHMSPLGHSPDIDLMAEFDGQLSRIQVKTSTYRVKTPRGHDRWNVSIATNGGNRSWSGAAKRFDPRRVDYLFVLVGDGRRWLIPANVVEASGAVALGGTKYSEFEVEPGTAIESLIYARQNNNRIAPSLRGECQSGQMDQTVNLTAMPTQVRILPPPFTSRHALLRPKRQSRSRSFPVKRLGSCQGTA